MFTKSVLIEALCIAILYLFGVKAAQLIKGPQGSYLDLSECGPIAKQCQHYDGHDYELLSCVINLIHNDKPQLPASCQHRIWTHQMDLLDNSFLSSNLREPCQDEPTVLECLKPKELTIACILKKKPLIKNKICWRLVNRLENTIFNDWQITVNFTKNCYDDIQAYSCGRMSADYYSLSQTETIRCLQAKDAHLRPDCQSEIAVLNEMKYSSYQLDKVIFPACSTDLKLFCSDEKYGSWSKYKCLLNHKFESGMTKKCKDQLFYDQGNVMVMKYRMSKGLVKSCKEDIRKYRCRKGVVEDKDVRLAQILLCLETVSRDNAKNLSAECLTEMIDHRKMLMDDYRLSPELMQNCANDITTLCKGVATGGRTIHCLMDHARPRKRKEKRISLICQQSLETLVREADLGEDWRVDPILREACKSVVDQECKNVVGGNGNVMSCLMEKLGTDGMNSDCEAALLQIQFFISRDFKLDPQLYKACKYDAVTRCKAKLKWADTNEHQSEKDPLIFPCLYNYAYNSNHKGVLQVACEEQVRRVMRQRAMSVDLLPEIEDVCMDDLANLCFENAGKGEEIQCLQNRINELLPKCKEVVTNFTETQSGHIELNVVVYTNCRPSIERLCATELKHKKEEDDVLGCLISHKNHPEIKTNPKCRAAIEHEQLISLKNYRFTRKFKNACRSYVVKYCPRAQTKSQVVTCLSEIVRNDTIKRKHTVLKDCRQQLRSQLFQQKESIDLDPELSEACKGDLSLYCSNVPHSESAALECLQTASGKLSDQCRKAIFRVRKQEFIDNAVDYHLIKSCSDMIDLYCHNTESSKVLDCLKAHKEKLNFDENCKIVIVNRMIEQNSDYRLNNNLQNSCNDDINNFCSEVIASEPQDVELQGKVLQCLKAKFRENKLTTSCENELANVLKEQALNYRLDPLLGKLCKAEIQTICAVPNDSITNSDGQVEECLKKALLEHKIVSAECAHEVVQIIEETKVDIEADPLLKRACALDLLKYCKDLEYGASRRLKCLKIILNDSTRKLEPECEKELSNRLEMYRYVASVDEISVGDMYTHLSTSSSRNYILVVIFSMIGLIFMIGLYCGRLTKHAMYIKRK